MRIALAAAAALWAGSAVAGQTYVCQTPAFWCTFAWHEAGVPDGSSCYCNSSSGPVTGYSVDPSRRGGSAPTTAPRSGPSSGPASGGTPVVSADPGKNVPGGGGGSTGGGTTGGGTTVADRGDTPIGGGTPVGGGGSPGKNVPGAGGGTGGTGTPVGRTLPPGGGGGGDPGLDTGECFRGLGNCVGQYLTR